MKCSFHNLPRDNALYLKDEDKDYKYVYIYVHTNLLRPINLAMNRKLEEQMDYYRL